MTVEVARDVAIISWRVEALVVTLLLGIVVVLLWRLVNLLQREIKPVLSSLQQTAPRFAAPPSSCLTASSRRSSAYQRLLGSGGAVRALFSRCRRK